MFILAETQLPCCKTWYVYNEDSYMLSCVCCGSENNSVSRCCMYSSILFCSTKVKTDSAIL